MGFYYDEFKGGHTGDWGKASKYWPDLGGVAKTEVYSRRPGANFNFGAAMCAGGWRYVDVLNIAVIVGGGSHSLPMQEAIACGYLWEQAGGGSLASSMASPLRFQLPELPPTN
jgi:hypothetical protein